MNRAEHLQWCKDRAIEYVELGEYSNAISSMTSDLTKHPDTHNPEVVRGTLAILLAYPPLTAAKIQDWIQAFN